MKIELFAIFCNEFLSSNFWRKKNKIFSKVNLWTKIRIFRVECISLPLFINSKKKLFLVCPWNWRFFSQQKWANWGSYCDTKSFKHVLGGLHLTWNASLKYMKEQKSVYETRITYCTSFFEDQIKWSNNPWLSGNPKFGRENSNDFVIFLVESKK